jgi:hypothetical protein
MSRGKRFRLQAPYAVGMRAPYAVGMRVPYAVGVGTYFGRVVPI